MVLVGIFFVSGADAASIVMGTLSEKGSIEPSKATVVFWGSLTGAVSRRSCCVVGGDDALTGLQQITIVAAVPFVLVMGVLCLSLYKDLQTDPMIVRERMGTEAGRAVRWSRASEEHEGQFALVIQHDPNGGDVIRASDLRTSGPPGDDEEREER